METRQFWEGRSLINGQDSARLRREGLSPLPKTFTSKKRFTSAPEIRFVPGPTTRSGKIGSLPEGSDIYCLVCGEILFGVARERSAYIYRYRPLLQFESLT
jgi:hypothetical protein